MQSAEHSVQRGPDDELLSLFYLPILPAICKTCSRTFCDIQYLLSTHAMIYCTPILLCRYDRLSVTILVNHRQVNYKMSKNESEKV